MTPAEHCILTSETQNWAEVIASIANVDDTIIRRLFGEERIQLFAFAHVRTASDFAMVLLSARIDSASQNKETGRIPFSWIGNYLFKEGFQAF